MSGIGGELDEDSIHSEMLTKLLAYFFCHRKSGISIPKAAEALWQEKGSDNPSGALKNLTYRLRNLMKKEWPEQESIITGRSLYKWTEEVQVTIDVEKFNAYCEKANEEQDKKTYNAYCGNPKRYHESSRYSIGDVSLCKSVTSPKLLKFL